MKIFRKLTLEILKQNKLRTIVTIIGIVLSAAMFTAVTSTISSLQNYMLQNAIDRYGDWHVSVINADETFFEYLQDPDKYLQDNDVSENTALGKVESYVYCQQIGYAEAKGCVNKDKPYIYLIGANVNFYKNMPVHLTAGRLPQNANEILLPDHLAENGDVHYKIGEELTLEIGNRVSDGWKLGQNNPYMNSGAGSDAEDAEHEYLEVEQSRTFTVVGFYKRPSFENYSAPGYTAITAMDKVSTAGTSYSIYFKLEHPQDALRWTQNLQMQADYNSEVLRYLGVSDYLGFQIVLYGLGAVLMGLIMFGAVSLIYNAFSISVSERTKQFGLLSSIGATRKQLRGMVLYEALIVSVIGIPIGILAGVGGMGITFYFLGKEFSSLTSYSIPLSLYVNPWSLAAACMIMLTTVLISVWIPAKRATRVTAVEAIRQSNDIKQSKTSRGEKIIYRFFGIPGMIADKYYKRSKKKYRATVLSLFMSIVLFVSSSSLTSYLTDMVDAAFESAKYDISYWHDSPEDLLTQKKLAEKFGAIEEITQNTYVNTETRRFRMENETLTDAYVSWCSAKNQMYGIETVEGYTEGELGLVFLEDAAFETLLEEYHLSRENYMDPINPLAVVFDGNTVFDSISEKYISYNVFQDTEDKIELTDTEGVLSVQIGEILYEQPYYIDDSFSAVLVYPYSMKAAVVPDSENDVCYHYMLSTDHAAACEKIRVILKENGLSKNYLYDRRDSLEDNQNLVMIVDVFSYGFIILISLIAAANVFHTISTNINLRRREFAMLKSVGMSQKEMYQMMNFESLLYGGKALLYGIPVSIVIRQQS